MSLQPPVIFVIGPPHHGKTETRKLFSELTYLKGDSTSNVIYRFLALRRQVSVEELHRIPKEELRPLLIEAGDFMVGARSAIAEVPVNKEIDDILYRIPSALIRTLYMNGYNIIDGVRRKSELSDARKHLEWNGVRHLTIWVERPGLPTVADNTELTHEEADEVLINDGSLDDLRAKAKAILEKHFGVQDETPAPIPIIDVPTGGEQR